MTARHTVALIAVLSACLVPPPARAALGFTARTDVALPVGALRPESVAVADFYGQDGALDLAITFGDSNSIGIFENDGAGNFTLVDLLVEPSPAPGPISFVGDKPAGIVAQDFDGDTFPDIAGTNRQTARFFAYLNETDLGAGWFPSDLTADRGAGFDLVAAEWSNPNDGVADLVFASDASVRIALGNGDGSFGGVTVYPGNGVLNLVDVEVANFLTTAPMQDVLTVDLGAQEIRVWPGDPSFVGAVLSGSLEVITRTTQVSGQRVTPFEAIVDDWNGDNRPDVLVGATEGYVLYYRNDGTAGIFAPPVVLDLVGPLGGASRMPSSLTAMVLADMDGDTVSDLVVADAGDPLVSEGFNWLSIYYGCSQSPSPVFDADGTTCARQPLHHAAADLGYPMAGGLVVENFDGVPGLDALLLNRGANSFTLYPNDGAGGLAVARSYSVGGLEPRAFDAGQLDGLAAEDLAVMLFAEDSVSVMLADGQGGFETGAEQPASGTLNRGRVLSVESFTDRQDATQDVLVSFALDQALWEGVGDGTLTNPTPIGAADGDHRVGNLGGTSSLDLAVVSTLMGTVSTWRGDGFGGFTRADTFGGMFGYLDHVVASFSGGPVDDIIVAGTEDSGPTSREGLHVVLYDGSTGGHRYFGFIAFDDMDASLTGIELLAASAGDLDGNGTTDLLAITPSGEGLALSNDGTGTGWSLMALTIVGGAGVRGMLLEDLNLDGNLDVAIARRDEVTVAEGVGNGTFAAPETFATNLDNVSLRATDVNGDRLPEILVLSGRSADVTVLVNTSPKGLVLRVVDLGSQAMLSWTNVSAGTVYDVLRGDLFLLLEVNRDTRDATCWQSDLAATTVVDAQPAPVHAGESYAAWYYLVRCDGVDCTDGTFGTDSEGTPRVAPADCP